MIKPIIKWAGGKTDLIPLIEEKINQVIQPGSTLFDVFAGGASVAFAFSGKFSHVVLNDTNKELAHLYMTVKNHPKLLMKYLDEHLNNHDKDYYYAIRNWDRTERFQMLDPVEKAARMLYLNKTCYNGLYRVNAKGEFNVPIGSRRPKQLYDQEHIMAVSETLKKMTIMNVDYYEAIEHAKAGDIVYLDPPYDKVTDQSFIGYNGKQFDEFDQQRLALDIKKMTQRGVYVIFSNSATPRIEELYRDYLDKSSYVSVLKRISSKADGRKYIKEILGDNFKNIAL